MEDNEAANAHEPVGMGDWVARQGDCIYSIAARTGHHWRTLWEHPQNESLRTAGRDPGILLPGDRVFVPPLEVKSVLLASGKRHRVVVDGQTVMLRIRLDDADGEPLANTPYRLEVAGQQLPVRTDDDGCFEVAVPSAAAQASLVDVATGETFVLQLGHMDPRGTPGAIRKRLANLGYDPNAPEGELDEHVRALLAEFVEDAQLEGDAPWSEILLRLDAREPWKP
jgi:hypothetical protein